MDEYLRYHADSSKARDIDPANDCLRYVADRFELNTEQRYWLAFLYATCYSATTTFFIYNEFPDFETVNIPRLRRWWDRNRERLIFQTDRRWTRSRNQWVDCVRSYQDLVDPYGSQAGVFRALRQGNRWKTYDSAFGYFSKLFTFGRFTMFLYLEMVRTLTGEDLEPYALDLAEAESSRNGLCFALGLDGLVTDGQRLSKPTLMDLTKKFRGVMDRIATLPVEHKTVWSVETTLCAYKKFKYGDRYVGYYIERSRKELDQMSASVPDGVEWSVLWDFRREIYAPQFLHEGR
jgi:hypothetical protein